MRLINALLFVSCASLIGAQQSTSTNSTTSVRPSATSTSSDDNAITTTITSVIPASSGHSATTNILTLTLTLNSSSLQDQSNHTLSNGTVVLANGTMLNNGTTNGTVWHEGDQWLPFHVVIDPAYGVLGAFFILSGIPVAILGGKNSWQVDSVSL